MAGKFKIEYPPRYLENEFKQTSVIKVTNQLIGGYLEPKRNLVGHYDVFTANDMVGIDYEKNSPYVLRNGTRLEISTIDQLIYELQQLKEIMEARKLARSLADN